MSSATDRSTSSAKFANTVFTSDLRKALGFDRHSSKISTNTPSALRLSSIL